MPELFLVLVRLRLGLLEQDLAHRFNIGIATVSRICITWIKFLNQQLRARLGSMGSISVGVCCGNFPYLGLTTSSIFTGVGSFLGFDGTPHFLGNEVELGRPLLPWLTRSLFTSSMANISAAV